jgi:hypothetical protein
MLILNYITCGFKDFEKLFTRKKLKIDSLSVCQQLAQKNC